MLKRISILYIFLSFTLPIIGFGQNIGTLTPATMPVSAAPLDVVVRGINTHFQNNVSKITFTGTVTGTVYSPKFVVANSVTATATMPKGIVADNYNVVVTTRNEHARYSFNFDVFTTPSSTLSADIVILPMESISLKDVDLSTPSKTPVLFFADIYNDNTTRLVDLSIAVSSGTKGQIGTMIYNNGGRGVTLLPGSTSKFTNQIFDAVKTNGQAGKDFLYQVELTGAFPPDNYTYVLSINKHGTDTPLITPVITSTNITNPVTNPSLITPGELFTDNIPVEYNPLPLFQWFGQSDRYDFAIYECRAGQSPEEAVRNIPEFQQKDVTGNSLLYPNSAEKLIDGKMYAWQVQGKMVSSNGTRYLPSEVFRFTYTNALNAGVKLVSRIQLTPEEVVLTAGQQYQFNIICYDDNNNVITDAKPVWNVTPNGGTISPTGLFTAGPGGTTVAVLVCAGMATEFSTVTITQNLTGTPSDPYSGFVKKLFGLQ